MKPRGPLHLAALRELYRSGVARPSDMVDGQHLVIAHQEGIA